MSAAARLAPIVLLVGTLHLVLTPQVRGEIVEEIVAWVDGDIITKSDLERQESDLIEAARQRYSGDELRRRLEAVRQTTLLNIIDHKILHHRGQQLWGAKEIEESYYRDFRQQQGLSDEEFEQLLAREGLTVERVKHLLSEQHVPDRIREHEVAASMPGIGDLEVRDYYDRHPDEFMAAAEVESRGEGRLIRSTNASIACARHYRMSGTRSNWRRSSRWRAGKPSGGSKPSIVTTCPKG